MKLVFDLTMPFKFADFFCLIPLFLNIFRITPGPNFMQETKIYIIFKLFPSLLL